MARKKADADAKKIADKIRNDAARAAADKKKADNKVIAQKKLDDAKAIAQAKADAARRVAAQAKADADARKAADLQRQADARNAAARLKADAIAAVQARADDTRRIAAQNKADAAAKLAADKQRQIDAVVAADKKRADAAAAAIQAMKDKIAAQKKQLESARELARLQSEFDEMQARVKAAQNGQVKYAKPSAERVGKKPDEMQGKPFVPHAPHEAWNPLPVGQLQLNPDVKKDIVALTPDLSKREPAKTSTGATPGSAVQTPKVSPPAPLLPPSQGNVIALNPDLKDIVTLKPDLSNREPNKMSTGATPASGVQAPRASPPAPFTPPSQGGFVTLNPDLRDVVALKSELSKREPAKTGTSSISVVKNEQQNAPAMIEPVVPGVPSLGNQLPETGNVVHLNSDVKRDISSLVPTSPPPPTQRTEADAIAKSNPQKLSDIDMSNPFNGRRQIAVAQSQSGGCIARAFQETRNGQVQFPTWKKTATDISVDLGSTALDFANLPPVVSQNIERLGYFKDGLSIGLPAGRGDFLESAGAGVKVTTVMLEKNVSVAVAGPGLGTAIGSIAGGATSITMDISTGYISPIIGQTLYDCFPQKFIPSGISQTNQKR